jgi:hypothetical protein
MGERTNCCDAHLYAHGQGRGHMEFAVNRMWGLITGSTQWARYTEELLQRLSVGGAQYMSTCEVLNVPEVYPYRISDLSLPENGSGFV